MLDIILFTRGTKGDLYPFLEIGLKFKERGHRIILLSNARYESYALDFGFTFFALDDEVLFEALNNTPSFHTNLSAKLEFSKNYIVAHLEKEVAICMSAVADKSNTVLLAHSNDYLVPLLVKELCGIPVHLFMLAPSYIHSFDLFDALLCGAAEQLNNIRKKLRLPFVYDWKSWSQGFGYCFAAWPDWFCKLDVHHLFHIQYIGFLPVENVDGCQIHPAILEFISGDLKIVFATHGTSRPFNDEYFSKIIEACDHLNCKLIISTPFRSLVPDQLPLNVLWVDYAPFSKLLSKVNLLIHHGGIGTVKEAIANRIPQLIIGQGFDRQHNGRIVRDINVGDVLFPKNVSKSSIEHSVSNLLGNTEIYNVCGGFAGRMYDSVAVSECIDLVLNDLNSGLKESNNERRQQKGAPDPIAPEASDSENGKVNNFKNALILKILAKKISLGNTAE